MMKKIGITGQSGFIGTHLYNFLKLQKNIQILPFKKEYFKEPEQMNKFVRACDVIVHLAGLNRHNDPDEIYHKNIELTENLIRSLDSVGEQKHIVFASSTQEELDNVYGKSKRKCREILAEWAIKNNSKFTGLIIPNIFGPFGKPFYNSVIATFSFQLTHGENPEIIQDNELSLLYVGKLVEVIFDVIENEKSTEKMIVPYEKKIRVSEILERLNGFKEEYFKEGIIPQLKNSFDVNLFNTFRSYIDYRGFFPFELKKYADERGIFVETIKTKIGGQFSYSTTKPGITRGNHFHTRKIERFIVIKGEAQINIRRIGSDKTLSFELSGENPSFVDMPIWYTHNITNIGNDELVTLFWINEFYNLEDPDTFYEKV